MLRATFPKTRDGHNVAEYAWSDGLTAVSPSNGRPGRLPHDLHHYIVESQVDMPYGFWALAARQAPYESFDLTRGRWPRPEIEWFERVKRKHRGEMVRAEAIGVVAKLARGELDINRDWKAIRRHLTHAYAYESDGPFAGITQRDLVAMVPFYNQLHRIWDGVPVGGALRVSWPRIDAPAVIRAYAH